MWASYIQLGTAGPALTCDARDSSPHTNDGYVEHIVPFTLWTEDAMKFLLL